MTLLWERMSVETALAVRFPRNENGTNGHSDGHNMPRAFVRLPGDKRCIARRQDGQRCMARIRAGSEYCFFHDTAITPEQRRAMAAKGRENRRCRLQLPKGYPRRLDNTKAVQRAMDRLYREIRLGEVDVQAGRALYEILCRLANLNGDDGATEQRRQRVAASLEASAH